MERTETKRGRPALPPGERKQQKNFRLSPTAIDDLEELSFGQNSNETEALERALAEARSRMDNAAL